MEKPAESQWSVVVLLGVTLTVLLKTLMFVIYRLQYSYRNMPPGPLVLPVIGNLLSLGTLNSSSKWMDIKHFKAYEFADFVSKIYGPIFSLRIGKIQTVIIASYDIIKEIEHLDEYSMKFCTEITRNRSMGKELGLIFVATPELWMEMRKFSQRTLRDFGFGKRYSMQSVIEVEITEIMSEFRKEIRQSNGIIKFRTTFLLSILNVLWCMVAGQRYSHDDPKLKQMLSQSFAMTKAQTFVDPLALLHPKLKRVFPKFFNTKFVNDVYDEIHNFSRTLIEERENLGTYLNEPENYIDCFLKKIHELKTHTRNTSDKKKTVYTYDNLQMMIEDLMQTGSTTTNGTINYALLFLTLNPEVQKRCQKEIDSVVSRSMIPTMDELEKMPYFQATILETHRLGNVVPIPIPRQTPHDWNLRGYFIPKDTWIISNHYSIQMDEKYWANPHNFKPERFINETGEFAPDKRVCHFGFGKRYCIGVSLADAIIQVYIATLIQNFNFEVVPGTIPPTHEPEVGVSLSPKEFAVLVTERL